MTILISNSTPMLVTFSTLHLHYISPKISQYEPNPDPQYSTRQSADAAGAWRCRSLGKDFDANYYRVSPVTNFSE